jgi:hypothetical protein
MEMRFIMNSRGLGIHPDNDSKKSRKFRHGERMADGEKRLKVKSVR